MAIDWTKVSQTVSSLVTTALPVVEGIASVAFPGAGVAISLGEKILQGVLAGVPSAVSLANDIKNGKQPTQAELEAFEKDYEDSYQKLKADIAAERAKLPTS